MKSITLPREWVERALSAMVEHGTHEEFDCPGDAPESCGWWCDICKQHINDDDRRGGHNLACPIEIFRLRLER